MSETNGPVANTDRELWREKSEGVGREAYAPSIHVTESGGIGINVGGMVHVMRLADWHRLATEKRPFPPALYWDEESKTFRDEPSNV